MSRGLNGETVFKAEDVLVGYVPGEPYGYQRNLRVTVEVRMEALDRQDSYETTGHGPGFNANGEEITVHPQVTRPLDFSITTSVWRPDLRDTVSGGATVEPLREVLQSGWYADGWDAQKVSALLDLAPWHLNAMSAGCDLQTPVLDANGHPSLDRTEPCPITGYKYGHAWLVRVLPDGFLNTVQQIFA